MAKTQNTPAAQAVVKELEPAQPESLLDRVLEETAARIEGMAARYHKAIEEAPGHMHRAMLLGQGIEALRKLLTPDVMRLIMSLKDDPNGFKTDRPRGNKGGKPEYTAEEIKPAVITALLNGIHFTNNELNVLAGQCYIALNGYKRKVEEIPGISDVHIAPGIPAPHNGQTVCRVALTWKLNGQPGQLLGADGKPGLVFPVSGSSMDQMIGKAKRKAYKAAFEFITGSKHTLTVEDGEIGEEGTPSQRTQEVLGKLTNVLNGNAPAPAEMVNQVGELSRQLQLEDAEFEALLPAGITDPRLLTRSQAETLLGALKKRLADEHAATEKAAMAFDGQ